MIRSFRHKGLRLFFESGNTSKIQPNQRKRLRLILTILQATKNIKDMSFPESNLHRFAGDHKDFWAVNVSGNWRIIFKIKDGEVYDVDYLDYH